MWQMQLIFLNLLFPAFFISVELLGNAAAVRRSKVPKGWQRRLDKDIFNKLRKRLVCTRTELRKTAQLFQGDIIIDSAFMDGSLTFTGELQPEQYWPRGTPVPYKISDNFDVSQQIMIRKAMDDLTRQVSGCIYFKERDDEPDYIYIVYPPVSTMCSSIIGRRTGEQVLNLGEHCMLHGTIQHELMHALGIFHEQSRPDRDQHIVIFEENIIPGTQSNFQILPKMATYGVPYDIGSVMHYGWNDLSVDSEKPTILPRDENAKAKMGQRDGMTMYDAVKLMVAYNCPVPMSTTMASTAPVSSTRTTLPASTKKSTGALSLPVIQIDDISATECRSLNSRNCDVSSQSNDCKDSILHIACGISATNDEIQGVFRKFATLRKSRPLTIEMQGNRVLTEHLFESVRNYVIELTVGYHNGITGNILKNLNLPHLLGLGFWQCQNINIPDDALYSYKNLRMLEFGDSTVDFMSQTAISSLPNLKLLALEYDVEPPFRLSQAKYIWKLHCSCDYQWLRDILIDKPFLIAEKQWGEIHQYGNRGSIPYTKKSIFIPVDCARSTERAIYYNAVGTFSTNVQC
ncbi:uncharacterized protein LOC129591859 [Paramacrobiotus metropolitanus]|uniref:uncharacterized protein LOC129591859 n=1 Tax=Paramacrobiotus metropolitanus TaxID=2943436 RepID=UPI00244659AF|nr:uncharacterized protein LOC129591859 [Paramacrobiotus metropolitanus]